MKFITLASEDLGFRVEPIWICIHNDNVKAIDYHKSGLKVYTITNSDAFSDETFKSVGITFEEHKDFYWLVFYVPITHPRQHSVK